MSIPGGESGYFEGLSGVGGLSHNHDSGTEGGRGLSFAQKAYFLLNHSTKTNQEIYAYFCQQNAIDPVGYPATKVRAIANFRASRKDLQDQPPTVEDLRNYVSTFSLTPADFVACCNRYYSASGSDSIGDLGSNSICISSNSASSCLSMSTSSSSSSSSSSNSASIYESLSMSTSSCSSSSSSSNSASIDVSVSVFSSMTLLEFNKALDSTYCVGFFQDMTASVSSLSNYRVAFSTPRLLLNLPSHCGALQCDATYRLLHVNHNVIILVFVDAAFYAHILIVAYCPHESHLDYQWVFDLLREFCPQVLPYVLTTDGAPEISNGALSVYGGLKRTTCCVHFLRKMYEHAVSLFLSYPAVADSLKQKLFIVCNLWTFNLLHFQHLISLFISEVRTLSFLPGYAEAIESFIRSLSHYTSGNWLSLFFRGSNIFHPNNTNSLEALNKSLKDIVRWKKSDIIGFVEKVRYYLQVHSLCRNALNGNSPKLVHSQPVPCSNDWKIAWMLYLHQKSMRYFFTIKDSDDTILGYACFNIKPEFDADTNEPIYRRSASFDFIDLAYATALWKKHKDPRLFESIDEITRFRQRVSFLEVWSHPDPEYFGTPFCNLPYICFCDYSIGAKEGGRGWVCAHQLGLGLLDPTHRDRVIASCPPHLNPRNTITPKGKVSKSSVIEKNKSLTVPKPKRKASAAAVDNAAPPGFAATDDPPISSSDGLKEGDSESSQSKKQR